MKIILGCIVETIATRQDGSLKFTCGTQELENSAGANLLGLRGKYVKVLLSDNNISPLEEKLVDEEQVAGGKKAKTPAQRLRNIMYIVHREQGLTIDFEVWYKQEMEVLISKYKEVLNE